MSAAYCWYLQELMHINTSAALDATITSAYTQTHTPCTHTKDMKVHRFSLFSYSIKKGHGPEYAALGRIHRMPSFSFSLFSCIIGDKQVNK